jgi:ATP-dependent DNA helicase DinG
MTPTWHQAWSTLEEKANLSKRDGQQALGAAVFENIFEGGQLVAEGPTGVGKTLTTLIPAIQAQIHKKQRTILTTETLSLLDQIVDKDLPLLYQVYGNFTYFGLKGRNHYLCITKAGATNPIVLRTRSRLEHTNGERRDVERILGYRMKDEDWAEIAGDTEFCSHNKCKPENCFSALARKKAIEADIVVTSHAMLQVHGEFIQQGVEDGLLGDFAHIVVDEAHVIVDGQTLEVAPWELWRKMNSIQKAVDAIGQFSIEAEELERYTRECIDIIHRIFSYQVGRGISIYDWDRESMALGQINLFNPEPAHASALEEYENVLPELLVKVFQGYEMLGKGFAKEAPLTGKAKGKVQKAITACRYLASLFGLVAHSTLDRNGTVEAYGTTFALFADGTIGRDKNGNDKKDITLRAVPMDVSQFLKRNLWRRARSVTLISATLRDHITGEFSFLKRSLGIERDAKEITVDSPFNFREQMLIHLTDALRDDIAEVPGARFSVSELRELIDASRGRSLVLFTSMRELEYVANMLRAEKDFPYTLLVQEKGVDKADLAKRFKEDTNSVLLASKSFFQGFDVPGDALTSLIMCKYSLPQYNATTKALIRHWRAQGFPKWYEMKSAETFTQAWGRLIRSNGCRGVVSLLDERVANPRESIHRTVRHVIGSVYGEVETTGDVQRVREWLDS